MVGLRSDLISNVGHTSRPADFLVKVGKKYYEQIVLPKLLIVLRIDPEIAVQRRFDGDAANIRARSTEIWELDCLHTRAHVIDASRSQAEVLSEVKVLIWSAP